MKQEDSNERERAAGGSPDKNLFWRSPEELAGDPKVLEDLKHEFPWRNSEEVEGMDRRDFVRLAGATSAIAALTGCVRQPPEKIVPYVNQPTEMIQGVPLFFATAMPCNGTALGLIVKSHMGHPIKVEGNPRHPLSLGATDAFAQASLGTLYDSDRSQAMIYNGRVSTWISFLASLTAWLSEQVADRGARFRLLTDTVISPTLGAQIQGLLAKYPNARWHQWEPVSRDNARSGARMAFGQPVNPQYRFDRADVIFSLDADFLYTGGASQRWAHDWSMRRVPRAANNNVNRLYVAETQFTSTGASADHRFRVPPSEMEPVLRAVAQQVGAPGGAAAPERHAKWVSAVVKDLQQHRGASVVIVGDHQPAQLHALGHAINAALGNTGNTVSFSDSNEVNPIDEGASLKELVADINAGKVDLLVMSGVNPVYDGPADLGFAHALERVKHKIHQGLYSDETAARCEWHIPQTHFLEHWSDCVAYDGTASIIQPLIAPLWQGRSQHELLAALNGVADTLPYEILRAVWRPRMSAGGNFEQAWRRSVHDGVIAGTTFPARSMTPAASLAGQLAAPPAQSGHGDERVYEVQFRPDPTIWDGRFANNSQLQELPKPTTKLTWDAVALISPKTASESGISSEALVELEYKGRKTPFPTWVQPGHADGAVTLFLGYGRTRAGRVGTHLGYNAYPLRTSDAPWGGPGLRITPLGQGYRLATTQTMTTMAGRYPVRLATLGKYRSDPEFAHKEPFEEEAATSETLYPQWRYEGYKWGMSIDHNACVGCSACVMACNIENNIAVVGKNEVFRGRIMHWLRIDRYYYGGQDQPKLLFQPVPCMHCENAPCEIVCPVAATNHSNEGVNQMIYNRCVGTRYCSNNCPYKVRRFNFFLYTDWDNRTLELMHNPEVTPRSRGVMEKCTYCIQRIELAKIKAQEENRPVRDGEIQTACQQACPTQAIVFGDLNDRNSRVSQLKRNPLDYQLLGDLNTRPRTTYYARVMNLNPELERELI